MHRRSERRSGSKRRFNSRADKTHRLNLSSPLRGGWRL